jgi:tetratricopeptide (TPR) repeat protein
MNSQTTDDFFPRLMLLALVAAVSLSLLAMFVFSGGGAGSAVNATPTGARAIRPAAPAPAAPVRVETTPLPVAKGAVAPAPGVDKLPTALPAPASADPDAARAAAVRGNEASQREDFKTAIEQFTRAIELSPTALHYSLRGSVYWRQGQLEPALADYNQAIALDPRDADGYFGRARVQRDRGDKAAARRDLQTFLELKPNDAGNAGIRQEAQQILDGLR